MQHIFCACSGCVEQLSKPWLPNLDKNLQPHYANEPETCKYYHILCGYNKWYISKLTFKKETTNSYKMEIKDNIDFHGMNGAEADNIEYSTIG